MIDEGRLAHTAVAAEQCNLVLQHRQYAVHTQSRSGRHSHTLVANRTIERHHHLLIVAFFVREDIGLVEHEHRRNAVSLGSGKKAVDENGACLRIVDRDDKESLVDIGSNDVALLAQVLRLAYDIVATVANGSNESRALLIAHNLHTVAHSNGIGAAYAFKAEVALYLAVYILRVVSAHSVPAARVLYY